MAKKYRVELATQERKTLQELIAKGTAAARTLTHARILLKADEAPEQPGLGDATIAAMLEVSAATVGRVRQRYVEAGLAAALHRKHPERIWERKLDGAQEAHLIALSCSTAPAGRERWSMRLLAEKMVELGHVEAVSHETIRRTLKKGSSNRG